MMNFQMTIRHPSGDINKLNGYMSLDSGGGGGEIGTRDKDLGIISIWIVFAATGTEESLGRQWDGQEKGAPDWAQTDQRKSKISVKETEEFSFLYRKNSQSVWFYESPRRKCYRNRIANYVNCFENWSSMRMKNWPLNLATWGCWYLNKSKVFCFFSVGVGVGTVSQGNGSLLRMCWRETCGEEEVTNLLRVCILQCKSYCGGHGCLRSCPDSSLCLIHLCISSAYYNTPDIVDTL